MADEVGGAVHFRERKLEGEGGLSTLVLTDSIHMQAVAAATGAEIVERYAEVIAPQEPLESSPRFIRPLRILGGAECLLTS